MGVAVRYIYSDKCTFYCQVSKIKEIFYIYRISDRYNPIKDS